MTVTMEHIFGDEWWNLFAEAEANKRITLREHREFPTLRIANYTPATAYESAWDAVTLASRGLIFDSESGDVLARPFTKFFNYGQKEAPHIDLDAVLYCVGDKYDGSLGIGYIRPDGQFAVATRGSFHSEQADHANALIRATEADRPYIYGWYKGDSRIGMTPLFEIIYPENRIVLDYEQQDYLQPIGWIRNVTGEYVQPGATEGFEDAKRNGITFRDVLSRAPRPNSEGYVVWLDQHTAVKIKQEDYVSLHAVVTNLSEKVVWGVAKSENGVAWREFVSALPDELQQWARDMRKALLTKVYAEETRLIELYDKVVEHAWEDEPRCAELGYIPRKTLAQTVQFYVPVEDRSFMFSILDGRDIIDKLFEKYKPVGLGARPTGSLAAEAG